MSEPPDHEARITALETQYRELSEQMSHTRQDAAAARVLAGGVDRDVAEIRTEMRQEHEQNMRLHNATRADLADLRKRVGSLEQRVERGFEQVDNNFVEIRGRLDGVAAGVQRIADLLTEPIARDERPEA